MHFAAYRRITAAYKINFAVTSTMYTQVYRPIPLPSYVNILWSPRSVRTAVANFWTAASPPHPRRANLTRRTIFALPEGYNSLHTLRDSGMKQMFKVNYPREQAKLHCEEIYDKVFAHYLRNARNIRKPVGFLVGVKERTGLPSHQTGLQADMPDLGLALHPNPSPSPFCKPKTSLSRLEYGRPDVD
ncbi:hypothetical protein B0H13DRAFT_1905754 [Mycena leptocephala]|nr:hypothetical protein B0H13DRAFT_1905754 [Mycena leptocephala]